MEPDRLGKYEIRGTLGKGAMGTVYEGWDPVISRKVAIKTVRLPDAADIDAQEELARFKREAQAAGRLTHPNIVGIFDYGETGELAYIVMEYVDGRTLKSILDAGERMALPAIGRIMADLLAGLQYSHDRGVVHRDIKPANVMIVGGPQHGPQHGDMHASGQAKIADFGIARIESSNLTQAGTIMGTPAYMSPEQFMGQTVDARTDIYSSGVLLFQLLTGERPFDGSMATIMHKALNTQPPRPSELSVTAPVALDAVVSRAMARRPEDRYPSAAVFAEAIRSALDNRTPALPPGLGDLESEATVVSAPPRPAPPPGGAVVPVPAKRERSRVPVLAGVAALALAALGGGAWFALSGTAPAPAPLPTAAPTVAAVAPQAAPPARPAAPVASALAPSPPPPQPPSLPAAVPEPRPAVTQAVPPSTPPAPGRRTQLAAAPRLEPAQIVPPAPAAGDAGSPEQIAQEPAPAALAPPAPAPAQAPVPSAAAPVVPAPAAAPAPTGPALASAGLSPEALRRAVGAAVQRADCAVVRGDLSRSGVLSLQGVIVRGDPVQNLLRRVREAAPTAPLDWAVQEASGPYCAALNLIQAYARPFGAASGGVDVGLKDGNTDLAADDKIDIRTAAPPFASYLQVDYFSSDGSVAHLRTAAQGSPVVPARSVQSFVAGEAAPPFGTDLIVAVASSIPLFTKGQPLPDNADAYLRDLRSALEAAKRRQAELAAGTVVVRTGPKP